MSENVFPSTLKVFTKYSSTGNNYSAICGTLHKCQPVYIIFSVILLPWDTGYGGEL